MNLSPDSIREEIRKLREQIKNPPRIYPEPIFEFFGSPDQVEEYKRLKAELDAERQAD